MRHSDIDAALVNVRYYVCVCARVCISVSLSVSLSRRVASLCP